MPPDLHIAFGQLVDGRIVSVHEVERGAACGCVCLTCGAPLIARKGEVIAHHFAHASDTSCEGETALHKLAKSVLESEKWIEVPPCSTRLGNIWTPVHDSFEWKAERAMPEAFMQGFRPDVLLLAEDRLLVVEFKVTHPVPDEKIKLLIAGNFDSIEVDLAPFRSLTSVEDVKNAVLRGAKRYWLHSNALIETRKRYEIWQEEQRLAGEALAEIRERDARSTRLSAIMASRALFGGNTERPSNPRTEDTHKLELRLASLLSGTPFPSSRHLHEAEERLSRLDPISAGILVGALENGVGTP